MKRFILNGCLIILMLLITACASDGAKTTEVKVADIYKEISEEVQMDPMYEMDMDYFSNSYFSDDFEPSTIKDYVLYESDDPLRVDTIILLELDKQQNAESAKEVLEKVRQQKMDANANGYNPAQYEIASEGVIGSEGDVIYLVISENKNQITEIIKSYFK